MAQYALRPELETHRRVMDLVDVDSEKWSQYAARMAPPRSWVYRREAKHLARFERQILREFDVTILISSAEVSLLRAQLTDPIGDLIAVPNGVDSAYFDPSIDAASPFPKEERAIVFTGAMDYWANVDAVTWFCHEILPTVHRHDSTTRFYIVGAKPTPAVRALENGKVLVVGKVPDVRPYLRHAAVVVAPMRIARGIQNKVLEGMAMSRPVVTTSKGLEGIDAVIGDEVLVADDAPGFAATLNRLLGSDTSSIGRAARRRVVSDYSWGAALSRFTVLLRPPSDSRSPS
jgi:sugar transferase (PEP-CTERM/EpsH1 system associated)